MLVNKKQEWELHEDKPTPSVKKNKPQINSKLRAKCFTIGITAAVMAMVITAQSEAIVRQGYDLVQLKTQTSQIEKENEQLRLDIAKLKSPQRIQRIAELELGMVSPQNIYCATNSGQNNEQSKGENPTVAEKLISMLQVNKTEAKSTH